MSEVRKGYRWKLDDIQEKYFIKKKHQFNQNLGFTPRGFRKVLDISRAKDYHKEKMQLKLKRAYSSEFNIDNPKIVEKWEKMLNE